MTYNVFSGTLNPTYSHSRCLTSFFPIVDTCLSCEDIARQSCAMVPRWRFLATFLRPVFSASRLQQVSDLHLKFALRPHHVSAAAEIRRGNKKRRRRRRTNHSMKIYMVSLLHRATIKNPNIHRTRCMLSISARKCCSFVTQNHDMN